ncbi:helix-turn-helix transcriptional regulator [Haloarcula nitratireducens]|uniref:helix-turn-helix transcriptional regulator n=1 Tax=Haloarcula nitratireducens TaxID=2487749 RepID=UPI002E29A9E3|nr:helix-turn-helix domain-containing protein [Halomicroarcula nitratireducens]
MPVAIAVGVLVLGVGLSSCVGTVSAAPVDQPTDTRHATAQTHAVESVDEFPCGSAVASLAAATGSVKTRTQAALDAHFTSTNVFSPVSSPSVVLLASGGLLALVLLSLIRVRERLFGGGGSDDSDDDQEPWKPLTDADRVEQLLAENDGYMKQSEIVEQTEWSKAKVSRLLSRMADRDIIRKDKDGRENIIVLKHRG